MRIPKLISTPPSDHHLEVRKKFLDLMKAECELMPAEEILAILSYSVGQLIALQDRRRFTAEAAMQVVMANIEAGNQDLIESLKEAKGGSA